MGYYTYLLYMELIDKIFEKAMDKNISCEGYSKTENEIAVLLWFSIIRQVENYNLCYSYKLRATDCLFDILHNEDSKHIDVMRSIKKEVGEDIVEKIDADLLGGI